jgi:hypothetical protein
MKFLKFGLISSLIFLSAILFEAKAQVYVIPEVGLNLSQFSFNKAGYENTVDVGFQAGVLGRYGKNAFLQAGVFYGEFANQLMYTDSLMFSNSDQIKIQSIFLPIAVGFNIVNLDIFKIRLDAGINVTFPLEVKENSFNVVKSDFNTSNVGFAAGFGLDIFRFVFDANFSFGMNNMMTINDTDVSLNLYTISIGYLIGKNY